MQGCRDKQAALADAAARRGVEPAAVAFVGNDVNDLECLQWVGTPIAVADAVPAVRAVATWVTTCPGGYGAVREVADWLLAERVSHSQLRRNP